MGAKWGKKFLSLKTTSLYSPDRAEGVWTQKVNSDLVGYLAAMTSVDCSVSIDCYLIFGSLQIIALSWAEKNFCFFATYSKRTSASRLYLWHKNLGSYHLLKQLLQAPTKIKSHSKYLTLAFFKNMSSRPPTYEKYFKSPFWTKYLKRKMCEACLLQFWNTDKLLALSGQEKGTKVYTWKSKLYVMKNRRPPKSYLECRDKNKGCPVLLRTDEGSRSVSLLKEHGAASCTVDESAITILRAKPKMKQLAEESGAGTSKQSLLSVFKHVAEKHNVADRMAFGDILNSMRKRWRLNNADHPAQSGGGAHCPWPIGSTSNTGSAAATARHKSFLLFWESGKTKSSNRHFTNKTRKWNVYNGSMSFVHLNLEINYSENWPKSLNDGVQDAVFSVVRKTNCPPLNLQREQHDKGANSDHRTDRYRSPICLWM